ncbi:hypothetical protein [Mesorhizobium sp. DCY119]|uniref:hypothetical protein n=1 Tax=Mesorhizobium sp. DCY119 TaxID=2108445 RepID=UPI0010586ABE|nr:hypothetical protein [Mesorhizobium sp. DCY119]
MNSSEKQHESVTAVEIPQQFESYVAAALLRVQVLFPARKFQQCDNGVTIHSLVKCRTVRHRGGPLGVLRQLLDICYQTMRLATIGDPHATDLRY